MNLVTIIGILASLLTAISLLPQLFKILKEKKSENVSYGMLFVLFTGVGLWIYYGCLKKDSIIIIANSVSIIINMIVAVFTYKYKTPTKQT